MIELVGVSKKFVTQRGHVEALANVDLCIPEGELVCLVGPSGCGKTTLLHLVAGLEQPDGGEVRVGGEPVRGPGPERGVMFQESALFPWLTARQNVEFGLSMQHVRRRQRRARALSWLKMVGVSQFADANVHELSGGMRKRVALARALALEPRILLMDEPFAALDVRSRAALHAEIERIWIETHKTIVFVTHDVHEAVRLGSQVIVLGLRPARVRFTIPISLPRPRHLDDDLLGELARMVGDRIDVDRTDGPDAGPTERSHGGPPADDRRSGDAASRLDAPL